MCAHSPTHGQDKKYKKKSDGETLGDEIFKNYLKIRLENIHNFCWKIEKTIYNAVPKHQKCVKCVAITSSGVVFNYLVNE